MKKINYLIISLILLIYINACAGYKPIFSSSKLQFDIANYSIQGDKKLGNQIYSKLYNLSKSNKNNPEAQSVHVLINASKEIDNVSKHIENTKIIKIFTLKIN